ncbi:MAG: helix-turn-helix domain-containing protein [Methanosarcinaceae archaeon]|nr:helix-turn-helix domain-containing protein [Methanosarcinaceae archaeon]MDD4330963.1 helix-turn-helix domain-containing protein [Methanosarcinaceae archaeon]MDD4748746.1 helix-turn-helix domain-containing protein [Methanosarcinaceae archaeon]
MINTLIESLQQLGLTSYEAKLIIALTEYGSGTASDIHVFSGIPRSAVYGVITKLENRGIIEVQKTKPMRYKIIPPDKIIDRIEQDYEKALQYSREKLKQIYHSKVQAEDEDTVWNISGIENVNDKIVRMLKAASKEIIFASSYPSLNRIIEIYPIMKSIKQTVQEKIDMGIKVKITGQDEAYVRNIAKEFPGAQIRVYKKENSPHSLKGGMLAIDNKEILVLSIKNEISRLNLTATWYNGKEQVRIFKHFMEAEWKNSRLVNITK